MIPYVSKGDPITAAGWNAVADDVNDLKNVDIHSSANIASERVYSSEKLTIQNQSGSDKTVGDILGVTGMRGGESLNPTDAKNRFMQSGFQLLGSQPAADRSVAALTEAVPNEKIGRCRVPGLFAAFVHFDPDDDNSPNYASAALNNGLTASESGNYKIVARSQIADGRAFCFLSPLGGAGGDVRIGQVMETYVHPNIDSTTTLENGDTLHNVIPLTVKVRLWRFTLATETDEGNAIPEGQPVFLQRETAEEVYAFTRLSQQGDVIDRYNIVVLQKESTSGQWLVTGVMCHRYTSYIDSDGNGV